MPEPRIATTPMSEACARPWTSRPAKRQILREKRQYRWTFADLCGGVRGGAGGIRTHDSLLTYTHFPGERLRHICNLSAFCSGRDALIAEGGFANPFGWDRREE